MDTELTKQEELAIELLRKVARHWPESLWIFAADGGLNVVRRGSKRERVYLPNGGVDQAQVVDFISIPADGGDW